MPVKKGNTQKTEAKSEKKKEKKTKEPAFAYGVKNIAERTGLSEVAIRGHLRRRGVEKAGKSYGWNTQKELEAVIKEITEKPAKKEKKEE